MKKLYFILFAFLMGATGKAMAYCTPTCSMASAGCSYGNISLFQIVGASGTLIDTLGCTGSGYEDCHTSSSITCTLNAGGSYIASFVTASSGPMNTQMWIDYNNDGTFDASETLYGFSGWYTHMNDTFYVPSGVAAGTYRLRFVNEYNGSIACPHMAPCLGSSYRMADARDYTVTIAGSSSGCSTTPSAGTASATGIATCSVHTVTLNDYGATSGSGITYQWQVSTDGGATWSNITGAVSGAYTMAEPTVPSLYRYVVTCGSLTATSASAAYAPARVWGNITYSSSAPDTVSVKVWLIAYDTVANSLTAVDSTISCNDTSGAYYEFTGMTNGLYLVKGKSLDYTSSIPGMSGFVPTYGYNSPHWSGATHVYCSGALNHQDIQLAYGTVTSGPGFIGGLISSGAGRGTSGDIPAVNMLVYLQNTTSNVITQAYTNSTGNYSFSGIANGTYVVYPEVMGYTTIPSAVITVSSSSLSHSGVNFKQYNTSKFVKPLSTSVPQVATATTQFAIAPNPSSGMVTIFNNQSASGMADLSVFDISGRKVYTAQYDLSATATDLNLLSLESGLYIVKINAAEFNYSGKITIQH